MIFTTFEMQFAKVFFVKDPKTTNCRVRNAHYRIFVITLFIQMITKHLNCNPRGNII